MKKIFKNRIFIFIITAIIFLGGGVKAASIYYANSVSYTPSDSNWKVTNVDEALNSLYQSKNELLETHKKVRIFKDVTTSASDYYTGTTNGIYLKNYINDWQNLTINNIYLQIDYIQMINASNGDYNIGHHTFTYTYNNATSLLTIKSTTTIFYARGCASYTLILVE